MALRVAVLFIFVLFLPTSSHAKATPDCSFQLDTTFPFLSTEEVETRIKQIDQSRTIKQKFWRSVGYRAFFVLELNAQDPNELNFVLTLISQARLLPLLEKLGASALRLGFNLPGEGEKYIDISPDKSFYGQYQISGTGSVYGHGFGNTSSRSAALRNLFFWTRFSIPTRQKFKSLLGFDPRDFYRGDSNYADEDMVAGLGWIFSPAHPGGFLQRPEDSSVKAHRKIAAAMRTAYANGYRWVPTGAFGLPPGFETGLISKTQYDRTWGKHSGGISYLSVLSTSQLDGEQVASDFVRLVEGIEAEGYRYDKYQDAYVSIVERADPHL